MPGCENSILYQVDISGNQSSETEGVYKDIGAHALQGGGWGEEGVGMRANGG